MVALVKLGDAALTAIGSILPAGKIFLNSSSNSLKGVEKWAPADSFCLMLAALSFSVDGKASKEEQDYLEKVCNCPRGG